MMAQVPSLHFLLPSGFSQWPRVSLQCTLRCQSCNRPVSSRSNEAKKTYFQRRPYYYNVVSSTIPVVIILDRRPYKASLVGALICSLSSYWIRFTVWCRVLIGWAAEGLLGRFLLLLFQQDEEPLAELRSGLPTFLWPASLCLSGPSDRQSTRVGALGCQPPLLHALLVRLYGVSSLFVAVGSIALC